MSRVYLYGFVPAGAAVPEGGLLGVGDAEVALVRPERAPFAAVASSVPDAEFSGEALERNCADVEWMAEQGLRHEQVVAWFVDHARILPSRLLTLFSSEAALEAAALEREGEIAAALERFADVREWDVKVGYDRARLEARLAEVSDEIADLDRQIAGATPGKRFLLEKKRKDVARTEVRAAGRRLAADLLDALRPHARDVRRLDLAAGDAPVLLNAALLVPRDREDALVRTGGEARERLEGLGLDIQLTGPWAPYRFLEEPETPHG